jgi:hypothetical protein
VQLFFRPRPTEAIFLRQPATGRTFAAEQSDAVRATMSGNNGQSITDYRNEINRSFSPHSIYPQAG